MRIRQVRPEFWTDGSVASLPIGARLFYIGLWCVADDFGWFRWNDVELAASLFPYEAPRRRERDVVSWGRTLTEKGRVVRFVCGCAWIPTLERHQINGGRKSATNRDKHLAQGHSNERVRTAPDVPEIPLVGSNGSNGNASGTFPDRADLSKDEAPTKAKLRFVNGKWVAA